MDNMVPRKGFKNTYEPFGEQAPVRVIDLVPLGTAGWMTNPEKIKAKFKPKAQQVMRIGYSEEHSSETYIVLKNGNGQVVYTRDVVWDKQWEKDIIPKTKHPLEDDADEDDDEVVDFSTSPADPPGVTARGQRADT
jgi:hypothetical protein